jgi:hypothetical protein
LTRGRECWPWLKPKVEVQPCGTNPAGPVRRQDHLEPIPADGHPGVAKRTVELGHQHSRAECTVLAESADVDVVVLIRVQKVAARSVKSVEVEGGDLSLPIPEIDRRGLVARCVDRTAEIDRTLPGEVVIVLRVFLPCDPQIALAVTARTVAVEEEPLTIRRQIGNARVVTRNVDSGPQVNWRLPRSVPIFPLTEPDLRYSIGVPAVDPSWSIRGDVKTQLVPRDRGVKIGEPGIHHRPEIDRLGPIGKMAPVAGSASIRPSLAPSRRPQRQSR